MLHYFEADDVRNTVLRDNRNVQVVVPKVEILDKSLIDTLNQYTEHAVDGYADVERLIDPATQKEVLRPRRSMLVRVPASSGSDSAGETDVPAEPTLINPNPSNGNLGARLRGLNQ